MDHRPMKRVAACLSKYGEQQPSHGDQLQQRDDDACHENQQGEGPRTLLEQR